MEQLTWSQAQHQQEKGDGLRHKLRGKFTGIGQPIGLGHALLHGRFAESSKSNEVSKRQMGKFVYMSLYSLLQVR